MSDKIPTGFLVCVLCPYVWSIVLDIFLFPPAIRRPVWRKGT